MGRQKRIACFDKWVALIVDKGCLQGGQAQFIVFKLLEKKVGLLNVYAPNSTRGRAQIWCQLWNDLPVMDRWCIVRDFNMLEDASDPMDGSIVTTSSAKLAEWEKLCFKFSLQDLWFKCSFLQKRVESLQFSRSNMWVVDANLSRFHADQFFFICHPL